jgi:hypothetical protein
MKRGEFHFADRRKTVPLAVCLALIGLVTLGPAIGQEARSKVSEAPLTAEQLAVYRSILQGWVGDSKGAVYLAAQTIPLDVDEFSKEGCGKGLDLLPLGPIELHRLRKEDLGQLGSDQIQLVDPARQEREVAKNDPGKSIRNGTSVDEALSNGIAHGLFTVSEIRFDKDHKHAIVSFGFRCGSLCGSGGTVVLEKNKEGEWHRKSSCSTWMS